MVAPNKSRRVVCTIVRVADAPTPTLERFVRKPSTLVPWADPYIAGLVRRLQSEVRMERAALAERGERSPELDMFDDRGAAAWLASSVVADLDPPGVVGDDEFEWFDLPRWSEREEG
jgi:hypothetical protein